MSEERDELETKIQKAEEELAFASYERERQEQLAKFKENKESPPKLTGVRRSKLSNDQKKRIISEYGIDTYNQIPL